MQNLDDIWLYIGTHNEVGTYLTIRLMDEKGLDKRDERIWFSQLFGMGDHITFNLALNSLMPQTSSIWSGERCSSIFN